MEGQEQAQHGMDYHASLSAATLTARGWDLQHIHTLIHQVQYIWRLNCALESASPQLYRFNVSVTNLTTVDDVRLPPNTAADHTIRVVIAGPARALSRLAA